MEGKGEGEGEVSSDGGCCLVVDEGRYLAYDAKSGEYYLSDKPQPIKGGRAVGSWYGARRFIIDDGSGDTFDKVAVGILHNGGGNVIVAGDRIKGEALEEEAGAQVYIVPPFVMKSPRDEPENISYANVFREGFIRLKAQLAKAKAEYKDDDDEDVDLETYFPEDKDFYVKDRDRIRNRIKQLGERHFLDHDMEDSGDDEFELTSGEEDAGEDDEFELTSGEEDAGEEDAYADITGDENDYEYISDGDGEDSDDDDEEDSDDDDEEDSGDGEGEDAESHKDKQSICRDRQVEETHYMDQDMEDSEEWQNLFLE